MEYQKYVKAFSTNNKDVCKNFFDIISNVEGKSELTLLRWTENEIEEFLYAIHATSPLTINKYLVDLRKFADYICEKENVPKREYALSNNTLFDYIDYERLLKTTINYQEYRHIKNQLDVNIRDKVIFELAWHGLTADQIRTLQKSDVTYVYNDEYGWDIAFINIGKELPIKIEDTEVVEDLKKCSKETYFYQQTKAGVNKRYSLRDSNYLIRPAVVGKNKLDNADECLSNPTITLHGAFESLDVTCPNIDIYALSVEDIRRSKLIYLLCKANEKYFDMNFIMVVYGMKNDSNLWWLKRASELKYK